MKQNHSSLADIQAQQNYIDNFFWGLNHLVIGIMGALWQFLLFAFILFIVYYIRYYHYGIRCNMRAYMLAYKDLDRMARPIVLAFLMFIIMTYTICI